MNTLLLRSTATARAGLAALRARAALPRSPRPPRHMRISVWCPGFYLTIPLAAALFYPQGSTEPRQEAGPVAMGHPRGEAEHGLYLVDVGDGENRPVSTRSNDRPSTARRGGGPERRKVLPGTGTGTGPGTDRDRIHDRIRYRPVPAPVPGPVPAPVPVPVPVPAPAPVTGGTGQVANRCPT